MRVNRKHPASPATFSVKGCRQRDCQRDRRDNVEPMIAALTLGALGIMFGALGETIGKTIRLAPGQTLGAESMLEQTRQNSPYAK